MEITILDLESLVRNNDIDFSAFEKLGHVNYYDVLPKLDAAKKCINSDAVIVNKTIVDKEFLDIAKNLKYVGLFATGYNNIDLVETKRKNIVCCNVPHYSSYSVAQFVFSYILAFSNSLIEYNNSVHNGDWIKSKNFCYFPYEITELKGKTIGIIGYGSIGQQVAKLAKAFEMNVLVSTRSEPSDGTKNNSIEYVFSNSDFVTIHTPLTKNTENMVNMDLLKLMKRNAVLINCSRGGVICENDLAYALNNDLIKGAAVDVVSKEPMLETNPLLKAKNMIFTPHVAWGGRETRQRLINMAADNLEHFINNSCINVVNK